MVCMYIITYLEGLNECPKQDPDGVALAQQFDQPSCSEQSKEADIDEVFLDNNKSFQKIEQTFSTYWYVSAGANRAAPACDSCGTAISRKKCLSLKYDSNAL